MPDPLRVLYYPDCFVDYSTLLKAILLFDELHFMDRPSMMFGGSRGQFGTIGLASPLRQYEASFREQGIPFYVHTGPMGPVRGEWYEQIKADVNDREFLNRFQTGLKTSPTFRALQIAPGNYGEDGDQESVAQRLMTVDVSSGTKTHESPMALFEDANIPHFDLSNPSGCAKHLIAGAAVCSAKINFALDVGSAEGFVPLADARPFGDLLGAKYARAMDRLQPAEKKLQLTDLSFAIFDELLPSKNLRTLSVTDAIRHRKSSEGARRQLLDHLNALQVKQAAIGPDGDYAGAIEKAIASDIRPAVHDFRNKLKSIDESLIGAVAKGVIGATGGSSALTLFGDLSWPKIVALAGTGAAYVAKSTIDAILAQRAARRECSISYILSLDE
jgi:hypothetical protein